MRQFGLIILLLLSLTANGQQRPIQSLYMFDPMLINPAYTGTQVQLSTTSIYRNQWINLEGAPKTFTTSVHSGFLRNKLGLGFIAAADKIGIHEDVSFYGTYAYRINLDKTTSLSMGLQAGFNNFRSDFTKLDLKNPNDPKLGGTLQRLNPNFGSGLYLRHKDYFIGFSVPYILNNRMLKIDTTLFGARQQRYYYLTAGITLPISDAVQWFPSALLRFQDKAPLSMDINSTFVLFKQVGLGVSYRLKEGLVGLFELQLNDNFHVGYAYDFTVSDINRFSAGTHELMVNYRIKISRIHRGLECPSYW
ncbi:MAG: type IX secretion system membrane protein PorP/SprF [Bacteroidetes bacterium]|nr:type IX secretion system membrane protein PorP/SprF [Bacteroidota bacterium]